MKTNLFNILLAVELSLGILAYANFAEAELQLNTSSLTGQVSRPTSKDRPQLFQEQ
ncbi:hypothetical protein [Myxosarcina sp. GI1]|uniref:hypothetical protein n=1 Tax=Myxosarcina sp. GI1 TaxID=1541065 RepID=UPI0012E065B2|nr:hypothetical protein [Myxosarcina sp. GI1]